MQSRYEVRDRDVEHTCRREAQKEGYPALHRLQCVVGQHAAEDHCRAREQIEQICSAFRIAGVKQDEEITDLLRYLVRYDRKRRDESQLGVREKSGCDEDAVDEVVKCIADEIIRPLRP